MRWGLGIVGSNPFGIYFVRGAGKRRARRSYRLDPSPRREPNGCDGAGNHHALKTGATLREAQIVIESWRRHYNAIRPHASLGYKPPAPEGGQRTQAAHPGHRSHGWHTRGRRPSLHRGFDQSYQATYRPL